MISIMIIGGKNSFRSKILHEAVFNASIHFDHFYSTMVLTN